jgi:hypothetical protein
MSKFDNLFNRPSSSSVTRNAIASSVSTLEKKTNSFISRSEEVQKPKNYNFLEEEFPDLAPKQKGLSKADINASESKKYSDITSTLNEVNVEKSIPVLPGWTQYSVCKKTGKVEVTHGSKTKRQIEQEKEASKMANSLYIYREMITTLEQNWSRYKKQYDKIHGDGAYDLVYQFELVYPEDEYLSDVEKDNDYGNDYEYDSYSQDETNQKNYSVDGKQ